MKSPLVSSQYNLAPKTSEKANGTLVFGIASLLMPVGGLIFMILAFSYAGKAREEIDGSNGTLTGLGRVKIGLVCAWLAAAIAIVAVVAVILVLATLN